MRGNFFTEDIDAEGSHVAQAQAQPTRVKLGELRRWTTVDELTHDFADCEEFRERCLAQHGQFVTSGGERVTAP